MKLAIVKYNVDIVRRYLPSNYDAETMFGSEWTIIFGDDVAGWTMEDYVIPRLHSGNIYAKALD